MGNLVDSDKWTKSKLFQPITVGDTKLQHRVAFAPLTRFRADKAHVPTDLQVEYYAQRASVPGTLLITEATFISAYAAGYDNVPGIWSEAQVEGWKKVTDAVHARGSSIYVQLWALGRASYPSALASTDQISNPGGPYPYVSSSDIPLSDRPATDPAPRPLTDAEIHEYIAQYAKAAENSIRAGFDGVEIHGAHGYLLDQFLQTTCNKREDQWGGSVERRCKFALAVIDAVVAAVGAKKTAIRLSPWNQFQDMRMPNDEDVKSTFSYLVRAIRDKHPEFAYLQGTEPRVAKLGPNDIEHQPEQGESNDFIKDIWLKEDGKPHNRVFISTGGYTAQTAVEETNAREGVLVGFGRHFIPNPDLPARIENHLPLTPYDRETFYTPSSSKGYTDFGFAHDASEKNYRQKL